MIKKSFENSVLDKYWEESLKANLEKVAVQSKRVDDLLFHKITDVVKSKQSKFSSVEDKVNEMMERSGLNAYLKNNVKLSKKANSKNEEDTEVNININDNKENQNHTVRLFKECPQALNTLDNIIQDSKGTLPVIGIIDKLHKLHGRDIHNDALFQDDSLKQFIAQKNLEVKAKPEESSTLGKNHFKDDIEENVFLESITG